MPGNGYDRAWHPERLQSDGYDQERFLLDVDDSGGAPAICRGARIDEHQKRQVAPRGPMHLIEPVRWRVLAGKDVWHEFNCTNYHTLFGEGAYYAPNLTKITLHRGEA